MVERSGVNERVGLSVTQSSHNFGCSEDGSGAGASPALVVMVVAAAVVVVGVSSWASLSGAFIATSASAMIAVGLVMDFLFLVEGM